MSGIVVWNGTDWALVTDQLDFYVAPLEPSRSTIEELAARLDADILGPIEGLS